MRGNLGTNSDANITGIDIVNLKLIIRNKIREEKKERRGRTKTRNSKSLKKDSNLTTLEPSAFFKDSISTKFIKWSCPNVFRQTLVIAEVSN